MAVHPPRPDPDDHQGPRGRRQRRPLTAVTHIPLQYDPEHIFLWPGVVIWHAYRTGSPDQFHALMLIRGYFNPGNQLLILPWDDTVYIEPPTPTPLQLALVRQLIADPTLASDVCYECNGWRPTPNHIRWNLHRGGLHIYNCPACAWDGTYPVQWTPDQWPPAFW